MVFVIYTEESQGDLERGTSSTYELAVSYAKMVYDLDPRDEPHVFINEEDTDGCLLREKVWDSAEWEVEA